MPRLIRLSDAAPSLLMAALEEVWADGDAAVVLPPGNDPAPAATAVGGALAGRIDLPTDAALVVTTSGSTAAPRAVVLTHTALRAATVASLDRLGCRPGEVWALALPVRHVAGLMVLLRARALGTTPVVVDPGQVRDLAAAVPAAQHVALVPTQLQRALALGLDLSGFATVLVGGGPASGDLVARARRAGIAVVTSYGMTETCGGCVYDGRPLDGVEVRLDAAGAISLRGPSIAPHALGAGPLTDAAGWFVTADHGRLEGGRLEVTGRTDDVIISGGVKIDPTAVEGVLRTSAAIADVIVIGVPDEEWGQRVRAVLAASGPVDLASLRELVARRLGPTHAPRDLLRVDAIPRDPMGKVTAATRAWLTTLPGSETYSPA